MKAAKTILAVILMAATSTAVACPFMPLHNSDAKKSPTFNTDAKKPQTDQSGKASVQK